MIYLYIFLQSNLLEWPIYLTQKAPENSKFLKSFWSRAAVITVMNSVTHPIVFFGLMNLPQTYLANVLCAEAFAILVEMAVLRYLWKTSWLRSLALSFLANLLSWQIAPMLTYALFQNG